MHLSWQQGDPHRPKKAAGPAKISLLQHSSCELPEDIECLETTGQTQTVTYPCASSNPG